MDKGKTIKSFKTHRSMVLQMADKTKRRKIQLIVFSVGFKPELINLELFGEPIIQTQTPKLLGILFDRRPSFNDHMKDLMAKVYRRLNLLEVP